VLSGAACPAAGREAYCLQKHPFYLFTVATRPSRRRTRARDSCRSVEPPGALPSIVANLANLYVRYKDLHHRHSSHCASLRGEVPRGLACVRRVVCISVRQSVITSAGSRLTFPRGGSAGPLLCVHVCRMRACWHTSAVSCIAGLALVTPPEFAAFAASACDPGSAATAPSLHRRRASLRQGD
jgi:hypothetical protein